MGTFSCWGAAKLQAVGVIVRTRLRLAGKTPTQTPTASLCHMSIYSLHSASNDRKPLCTKVRVRRLNASVSMTIQSWAARSLCAIQSCAVHLHIVVCRLSQTNSNLGETRTVSTTGNAGL